MERSFSVAKNTGGNKREIRKKLALEYISCFLVGRGHMGSKGRRKRLRVEVKVRRLTDFDKK